MQELTLGALEPFFVFTVFHWLIFFFNDLFVNLRGRVEIPSKLEKSGEENLFLSATHARAETCPFPLPGGLSSEN